MILEENKHLLANIILQCIFSMNAETERERKILKFMWKKTIYWPHKITFELVHSINSRY